MAADNPHPKHPYRHSHDRLLDLVHSGPPRIQRRLLEENSTHIHARLHRVLKGEYDRLLSVTIVTAEFQYDKVIENFKFLQAVPGLALFNLL
jgi:hypothetical protein